MIQSTSTLLSKSCANHQKLSRQVFGLTLALALSMVAGSNTVIAQAKDKTDEPAANSSHHSDAHRCSPPGPPPEMLFGGPHGGPPPPPMALPLMGVDLTDEQIDKLSELHTSFMERSEPTMLKLHSLEKQFRLALTSSSLNVEEVNGLRSKIAAEKVTFDAAIGGFAVAQAQVLTPEQRHKIKIDLEKFEVRGGFGPHFGPPPY